MGVDDLAMRGPTYGSRVVAMDDHVDWDRPGTRAGGGNRLGVDKPGDCQGPEVVAAIQV